MKKKIFSLILAFSLFFGIASNAFAAAYISPSNQTIYGSTATANWTFSWSGGSGHYIISFKPDSTESYKVIDSSTKYGSTKHSHEYWIKGVSYKYHYPQLLVQDWNDPHLIVGVASAQVFQRVY